MEQVCVIYIKLSRRISHANPRTPIPGSFHNAIIAGTLRVSTCEVVGGERGCSEESLIAERESGDDGDAPWSVGRVNRRMAHGWPGSWPSLLVVALSDRSSNGQPIVYSDATCWDAFTNHTEEN